MFFEFRLVFFRFAFANHDYFNSQGFLCGSATLSPTDEERVGNPSVVLPTEDGAQGFTPSTVRPCPVS
jgi:hypothetical protein